MGARPRRRAPFTRGALLALLSCAPVACQPPGGQTPPVSPTSLSAPAARHTSKGGPRLGAARLEAVLVSDGERVGERHVLANGLTVLLWREPRAPAVVVQLWVRAGSRHDPPGQSGVAHLLEHLMFRHHVDRHGRSFARHAEAHGVDTDAITWLDYTFYSARLPDADALDAHLAREASRMRHPRVDPAGFEVERDVVRSERLYRVDNDPRGAMLERLYSAALAGQPYARPTLGRRQDLGRLRLDDCLAFHAARYVPGRAALVIAGDVEREAALAAVRRHFGALPGAASADVSASPGAAPVDASASPGASRLPTPVQATPAPPDAPRQIALTMPVDGEVALLGFAAPALDDPSHLALEVADALLFAEPTGVAWRALVREHGLATRVTSWVGRFRDPSLYEVMITLRPGVDHARALDVLEATLRGLDEAGPAPEAVARAGRVLTLRRAEQLQTLEGLAEQLGHHWATLDEPTRALDLPARLDAVTPAAVRAALRRLRASDVRATVVARPLGERP